MSTYVYLSLVAHSYELWRCIEVSLLSMANKMNCNNVFFGVLFIRALSFSFLF